MMAWSPQTSAMLSSRVSQTQLHPQLPQLHQERRTFSNFKWFRFQLTCPQPPRPNWPLSAPKKELQWLQTMLMLPSQMITFNKMDHVRTTEIAQLVKPTRVMTETLFLTLVTPFNKEMPQLVLPRTQVLLLNQEEATWQMALIPLLLLANALETKLPSQSAKRLKKKTTQLQKPHTHAKMVAFPLLDWWDAWQNAQVPMSIPSMAKLDAKNWDMSS